VIAAGAEHAQPAFTVDHEGVERVAVARDLSRGQVNEGVRPFRDQGQVGPFEDAPAMEAEAWMAGEAGEVVERPVREVVEAGDLVAACDQPLGQVRADETRDARDGDPQTDLLPGASWTRK